MFKEIVEMKEEEFAERINALDDLEEVIFVEDVDEFEDEASLSLEF